VITFSSLGRLGAIGNQMFEYASLRGIADKQNQSWKIPHKKNSSFYYGLMDCFEMSSVTDDNFINNENFTRVRESSYSFDSSLFLLNQKDFDLFGYFQSEKYFMHMKDEIRKDFTFKEENKTKISGEYIFLHVRRQDYVELSSFHPPCLYSYYENALQFFPDDIQVRVYSDDFDWCREHFKSDRYILCDNHAYYDESAPNAGLGGRMQKLLIPYYDLYEMSQCKGGIISNSSFAWWGAWLIEDKKYPIIAPTPWFGVKLKHNTKDLIPNDWKIIGA
jgi:hypothetical protein